MSLVLTVLSYRRQPLTQPLSQRFDAPSITVGRAPDNDWTLPDPDQLISKKHCAIRLESGQYRVVDTSTNGVFVNGAPQPLGNGQSTRLADGDRLQIGEYEILVKVEGATPAYADPRPLAPPAALPVGAADDPFGLTSLDFAQPAPATALPPIAAAPAAAVGRFPAPADDPFAAAPDMGMSGFAAPAGSLIPEGPDWLLPPGPPPGELAPDQFAQPDHLAAEHVHYQPPGVVARAIPDNWDPLGEAQPPVAPLQPLTAPIQPSAAPIRPPVAPIQPPVPTPSAAGGFAAAAPIPPAPLAPPAGADAAALLAAFLEGAGIPPAALQGENPAELMAAAGRLFRALAAGLRDALATRAMIKAEYRVEQTVIRAANNNPLKFAIDVEPMLAALLARPRPGYLPGGQAVEEGFRDLRAHELALLGGMQAAVAALLRQFDPEPLKQRLEQQSLLQNLLPAARKAKYWEIYEQHYKQIAADVSEDVRGTFGRAFATAYEEQARKL